MDPPRTHHALYSLKTTWDKKGYPTVVVFLCPRYRAGLCNTLTIWRIIAALVGFYALGIGLGFVTDAPWRPS